jgi:hypothetical protein
MGDLFMTVLKVEGIEDEALGDGRDTLEGIWFWLDKTDTLAEAEDKAKCRWLRRMEYGEESEGYKRRFEAQAKLLQQREEEEARLYLKAQRTEDPTERKAVHEEYLKVVRKYLPTAEHRLEPEYQARTEAEILKMSHMFLKIERTKDPEARQVLHNEFNAFVLKNCPQWTTPRTDTPTPYKPPKETELLDFHTLYRLAERTEDAEHREKLHGDYVDLNNFTYLDQEILPLYEYEPPSPAIYEEVKRLFQLVSNSVTTEENLKHYAVYTKYILTYEEEEETEPAAASPAEDMVPAPALLPANAPPQPAAAPQKPAAAPQKPADGPPQPAPGPNTGNAPPPEQADAPPPKPAKAPPIDPIAGGRPPIGGATSKWLPSNIAGGQPPIGGATSTKLPSNTELLYLQAQSMKDLEARQKVFLDYVKSHKESHPDEEAAPFPEYRESHMLYLRAQSRKDPKARKELYADYVKSHKESHPDEEVAPSPEYKEQDMVVTTRKRMKEENPPGKIRQQTMYVENTGKKRKREIEIQEQRDALNKDLKGAGLIARSYEPIRLVLIRGVYQDETEIKRRRTVEISEHRAKLNLDLVKVGKRPITYQPMELFKIHDEYHDKVEWEERQKAWHASFQNAKDFSKGHVKGEREYEGLNRVLQEQRDLLPGDDDDWSWTDVDMRALKENITMFCTVRRLMDQSYYENKYLGSLFDRRRLEDPMVLTDGAVEVGWRLGFFRMNWKSGQNWLADGTPAQRGNKYDLLCQRALLLWMPSAMRTGFTIYLQDFFVLCTSRDPEVRKIVYTHCYEQSQQNGGASQSERSLPTLQYHQAVVLKVARELYDLFPEDNVLEPILKPFKLVRQTEDLTKLKGPTWQRKHLMRKKGWVSHFGIGELRKGTFDKAKFDRKELKPEKRHIEAMDEWLQPDRLLTMTGWFCHRETGNNHSNWDRSRQNFVLKGPEWYKDPIRKKSNEDVEDK